MLRNQSEHQNVLIETYWNVKYGDVSKIFAHHQVLIETYWNVKMGKHYGYGLSQWVLIETYWNVKTDPVVITGDIRAGINRNILECKAQRMIASHLYLSVLIETYWNVK